MGGWNWRSFSHAPHLLQDVNSDDYYCRIQFDSKIICEGFKMRGGGRWRARRNGIKNPFCWGGVALS